MKEVLKFILTTVITCFILMGSHLLHTNETTSNIACSIAYVIMMVSIICLLFIEIKKLIDKLFK